MPPAHRKVCNCAEAYDCCHAVGNSIEVQKRCSPSAKVCPPEGIDAGPCELPIDPDVCYCVDACENHVNVGVLQHAGRYIQGAGKLPVLLGSPPQALLIVPETSQRNGWGSKDAEVSRHLPQIQGTGFGGTQHGCGD